MCPVNLLFDKVRLSNVKVWIFGSLFIYSASSVSDEHGSIQNKNRKNDYYNRFSCL